MGNLRTKKFAKILVVYFIDTSRRFWTATKQRRQSEPMRRSNNHVATPIVRIPAHATTGDLKRFLEDGINDYNAKPVKKKASRTFWQSGAQSR